MAVPDQPRIHPDEALLSRDGVGYRCRFEGVYPVPESRGVAMVTDACRRMAEGKPRRREETGVRRAPIVELRLSVPSGLEVRSCPDGAGNPMTAQTRLLWTPLDGVAFAATNPANRRYVGFVVRSDSAPPNGFECHLFKLDLEQSYDLIVTANQAFELTSNIANENLRRQLEVLRSRLRQLASRVPPASLQQFLGSQGIFDVLEISPTSNSRVTSVFRRESNDYTI